MLRPLVDSAANMGVNGFAVRGRDVDFLQLRVLTIISGNQPICCYRELVVNYLYVRSQYAAVWRDST